MQTPRLTAGVRSSHSSRAPPVSKPTPSSTNSVGDGGEQRPFSGTFEDAVYGTVQVPRCP